MNATAGGRPRVITAGVPAMTISEIRMGVMDKNAGRHWSRGECWCWAGHPSPRTWHYAPGRDAAKLLVVPPPWDEARRGESVR